MGRKVYKVELSKRSNDGYDSEFLVTGVFRAILVTAVERGEK